MTSVHCSAKVIDGNEITPQSNVIRIEDDGTVGWWPRFELGVSQCPVDVTWFPFDRQKCELVFESWILHDKQLVLTTAENTTDDYALSLYIETDMWHLTRKYLFFTKLCLLIEVSPLAYQVPSLYLHCPWLVVNR